MFITRIKLKNQSWALCLEMNKYGNSFTLFYSATKIEICNHSVSSFFCVSQLWKFLHIFLLKEHKNYKNMEWILAKILQFFLNIFKRAATPSNIEGDNLLYSSWNIFVSDNCAFLSIFLTEYSKYRMQLDWCICSQVQLGLNQNVCCIPKNCILC